MTIAKFYRYGVLLSEEFDSLDEAASFLAWGEDAGTLSSHEIHDGERVITDEELLDLVMASLKKLA